MSIPICGVNRMLPERRIYDAGVMRRLQKPGISESANQMTNNPVKDADEVLSADELGKSSGGMVAVKADYNDGCFLEQKKITPKFSEFELRGILPEMRMYDGELINDMQNPNDSETTDQMINNPVKDADEVLSTDELGKSSGGTAAVKADDTDGCLLEQERITSKFSKLEERDKFLGMRGLKIYRMRMNKHMTVETGSDPIDVTSETQNIDDTETTDVTSETQSISDLVKQLLSQLNLSEKETDSFLDIMKNYGIEVAA